MKQFSTLLDSLLLSPSRNHKIDHLKNYFDTTQSPQRGYGLAALTASLHFPNVSSSTLKKLVLDHIDEELFKLSYDFVGDLAETIAHLWPENSTKQNGKISLVQIIEEFQLSNKNTAPALVAATLDSLPSSQRYAFLKLITGGLRVGVSERLCKVALAEWGQKDVTEIEEIWHGLQPPYDALFLWLEGKAPRPQSFIKVPFRPVMLANALSESEFHRITQETFAAEWKWDGIRVQAVKYGDEARLYTRTGEDISSGFPDIIDGLNFEGVIDGELLIMQHETRDRFQPADFNALQKRLNRKSVSKKLQLSHPAFIRAYDILFDNKKDVRALPFIERRILLERVTSTSKSSSNRIDTSPILQYASLEELRSLRASPPHTSIEGVMLKDKSSPYLIGRKKGLWYKWKKDPYKIDALLMYAQRGHGKRSGMFSDFTFGVWHGGDHDELKLVPVGKAYFGFTDEELKRIDKFVRENTIDRFGPVRSVQASMEKGLVLEIAFDGIAYSKRHKSGVAMRFPRVAQLRWDKPPSEIDRLEDLTQLIEAG